MSGIENFLRLVSGRKRKARNRCSGVYGVWICTIHPQVSDILCISLLSIPIFKCQYDTSVMLWYGFGSPQMEQADCAELNE
jgi:hypothetical protein